MSISPRLARLRGTVALFDDFNIIRELWRVSQ
jgi:hypothetical protein